MALCFVLTLVLCCGFNAVQAAGIDEITPDSGFQFFYLMGGQSTGSISTTASTAFDMLTVALVSIGNSTLTASLKMESEQRGMWWLYLISIARKAGADADFTFGFIPVPGGTAEVAVNPTIGFALALGGFITTSPITEENPVRYSITVTGR